MVYRITQMPMTLSEFRGHFCFCERQDTSLGPSACTHAHTHTHTHTHHFAAVLDFVRDYPGELAPER